MVRLVLFDIDGTLIHTNRAGVAAFGHAFATEFRVPDGTSNVKFAGRTDTGIAREMFERHGVVTSPQNFQRFFDAYVFWLDYVLAHRGGGVFPGVWEFVRGVRSLSPSPAIGLLTGNIRLGAEIKLRRFDLWDAFQIGAFGDDHEDRNQLAAIAQQRGHQLAGRALNGDEILVVGDTPLDVECARSIGARVLAVATGGATADQLKAHRPNWLVSDLQEVSAAVVCR